MEMNLSNNFMNMSNNEESLITGGASATQAALGALGMVVVAPICGVIGGPAGFAVAYVPSLKMLLGAID